MKKLTVLYISNQGGGAPRSLLNMIHALSEYVEPIVMFENDWYDYQRFVSEGIECIIVPYRLNMILDEPGSKTLKYKIHRLWDEFAKNHLAPYIVAHKLRDRKIDIVHTNTGAITIGNAIAKKLKAKSVWHIREFQDIDFGGHPYKGWSDFYRKLNQADCVIGISRAIGAHFHFERLKNAHVIWDAVRSVKDISHIYEKGKYILYCSASITEAKGLDDLLVAYAKSELPHNGIKLVVLGVMDANYELQIKQTIAGFDLQSKVVFEGCTDHVKPYFEKALAFVLPSLNEGLGRVVIEAMFYGTPVICRKAGGPLEYIEHGQNGYFFSGIDDLSMLLNKVTREDTVSLVERAQKFAVENFSEEAYGQKIMNLYRTICL